MSGEFRNRVFFLEWPVWAQLAILLGGALVLVMLLAFVVKFKNWARDKRRTKRAAEERAERGEMTLIDSQEEDTPFGIRALLGDPEVEGVWNSREATPVHLDGAADTASTSQLDFTSTKHPSTSLTARYDTADIGLASPTTLIVLPKPITIVDLPAERSTVRRKRKTLVISHSGSSFQSEVPELVSDIVTPMRRERMTTPSPSKMQVRHVANLPTSGQRKFVIGGRQTVSPGYQRTKIQPEDNSLEHMEAQRRLQSAESGQLLPRDRRHSDMVQAVSIAPLLSDSEDSDDSTSRALSWPSRIGTLNLGKRLSRRVQRMEGPRPVPFRALVESLPASKPPPSAWTNRTQARMEVKAAPSNVSDTTSRTSKHTPNSSTSSTASAMAPTSSPSDIMSIANTQSRKINDGFEVLPAGTLNRAPKVKEFGTWHDNLDAHKKQKKLQKRPRSDSASRSSSESRRFSSDNFRRPIF